MRRLTLWFYLGLICALVTAAVPGLAAAPALSASRDKFPEPEPPSIRLDLPEAPRLAATFRRLAATTEWTFHKTADGRHPDGNEQQMVWLMNRARANPTREGEWLAALDDPDVAGARTYFGVDLGVLRSEFAALGVKPPAAFDARLYAAAKAHSDYLIASDSQSHTGQFTRIADAGFQYSAAAGIVFSYAEHALHAHAAFNIDWGCGAICDGTGMQPGRGHRKAVMSVDAGYANVGIAVVGEANPATGVGPQVITGNLCTANTGAADHHNRFLVGTVWTDANANGQYDPGEGLGGVRVEPDQGPYYAVTADGGGYALPVTAAGIYLVRFSGAVITTPVTLSAAVGAGSVLLDFEHVDGPTPAPEVSTGPATAVTAATAVLNGSVDPKGVSAAFHFEYGPTTAYGATTASRTVSAESSVSETVGDLLPGTIYHYRLVASSSAGTSHGPDRTFSTATAGSGSGGSSGGGGGGGGGGCFIRAASGEVAPLSAAEPARHGWLLPVLLLAAALTRTMRARG